MSPPTVYQLDRNVVIEIENHLKGKSTAFVSRIAAIDKSGNKVSPLLSVTEGHIKEDRDALSFEEALEREAAALDGFFQHAKTDTSTLKTMSGLATAFIGEVRSTQDDDIRFLKGVQTEFSSPTSRQMARREYDKAKALIRQGSRPLTDKFALACVATALGCEAARGVVKPTSAPNDSHAFNALADIEKISFVRYMRVLSFSEGVTDRIELFTFDEDLASYYSLVKPVSASTRNFTFEEVSYEIPLDPLMDSMLHLAGKVKLRREVEADLARGNFAN